MTKHNIIRATVCAVVFILIMMIIIFANNNEKKQVSGFSEYSVGSFDAVESATVGVSSGDDKNGVYNVGSGVVVSSEGHIITSCSIIGDEHSSIVITADDGRKISAVPVWKNEVMDIAIVKSDYEFDSVIEIGDIKNITVGDRVYASGKFVGAQFKSTLSEGIISGMHCTIADEYKGENVLAEDLISTDVQISSGGRGGALINENDELIGVVIMKNGSFYAVPVNVFAPIVERLSNGEYVKSINYGMYCYNYDMMQYLTQNFESEGGVMAVYVQENSIAQKSGVVQGDIITAVDGKKISNMIEFYEIVNSKSTGEEIILNVKRGEKTLTIKILDR